MRFSTFAAALLLRLSMIGMPMTGIAAAPPVPAGASAPASAAATAENAQPVKIDAPSPSAALAALKAKPGTVLREQNDWIVISDPAQNATWSFAAESHPRIRPRSNASLTNATARSCSAWT